MAVNIGPKIGIDGEAKYRAEINNIIQQAKMLDSEMRAVTSSFADNASALEKNTATSRVLTQQISVQEQRISKLSEMLAKSAAKYGENDTKTLKWRQAVNEATASLNKMQSELDQSTNAADDYGDAVDDAQEKTLSFGDVLKANIISDAIINGLQAIVDMFSELGSEALTASDSLDKFESTMKFAGFDDAAIQQAKSDMQDYAADTVYDLTTVANTTAQLAANGVENFEELTEAAGNLNAVAGGNADTFKSVAMVLTQTAGAGKLTTENWNQLTDAIPGASGVLQQAMLDAGAYTGNFREAMEEGEVSAEEFLSAIMQLGTTPEAESAAANVDLIEGAIGNLKATVTDFITAFLEEGGGKQIITDTINGITTAFLELTQGVDWESFRTSMQEAFETIVPLVKQFADFVINNFPVIAGVITGAGVAGLIGNITAAVWALTAAMAANPIDLIITAIAAVVAGLAAWIATDEEVQARIKAGAEQFGAMIESIKLWMQNLDAYLDEVLGNFFNVTLPGFINTATLFVQEKFTQIGEFFATLWEGIVEGVKSFGDGVVQTAGDIVETVKSAIDDAVEFIKSLPEKAFQWGADLISGFIDGIKSIDLGAAIEGVANTITSFLHFSRPDVGPLREYESWMPDMMAGLAKGILDNQYLLTNALATVTRGMENSFSPALAVSGGSGTVVHIESVSFTNYTPNQGAALVDDLNRQLGRLL